MPKKRNYSAQAMGLRFLWLNHRHCFSMDMFDIRILTLVAFPYAIITRLISCGVPHSQQTPPDSDITVTSYERHSASILRQLICFPQLVPANNKKDIGAPRYWLILEIWISLWKGQ